MKTIVEIIDYLKNTYPTFDEAAFVNFSYEFDVNFKVGDIVGVTRESEINPSVILSFCRETTKPYGVFCKLASLVTDSTQRVNMKKLRLVEASEVRHAIERHEQARRRYEEQRDNERD